MLRHSCTAAFGGASTLVKIFELRDFALLTFAVMHSEAISNGSAMWKQSSALDKLRR